VFVSRGRDCCGFCYCGMCCAEISCEGVYGGVWFGLVWIGRMRELVVLWGMLNFSNMIRCMFWKLDFETEEGVFILW